MKHPCYVVAGLAFDLLDPSITYHFENERCGDVVLIFKSEPRSDPSGVRYVVHVASCTRFIGIQGANDLCNQSLKSIRCKEVVARNGRNRRQIGLKSSTLSHWGYVRQRKLPFASVLP